MTSPLPYTIGTVTLVNGSAEIEGNGTSWWLYGVRGGLMTVEVAGGNPLLLATVTDDTTATAATKWMGPSGTYNYAISLASADAADAVWSSRHWSRVVGQALLSGITPVGAGTLAERDALSPQPENDSWFIHAEPPHDLTFWRKVPTGWQGPYQWKGERGGDSTVPGPAGDGFNPAGAWVAGATYAKNDMVSFDGRSFVSFASGNIGNQPPSADSDDAHWQYVPAAVGPANVLSIGEVAVGPANAEIVGNSPAQQLNLTLPLGPPGPAGLIWCGDYGASITYNTNDAVMHGGSSWVALQETLGNPPPNLPTTADANWQALSVKGTDGLGAGDMLVATYDPNNKAADAFSMSNMAEGADAKIMTADERAAIAANSSTRHSHDNKAVLDATEQAFTSALKTKIDNINVGTAAGNIPVLDGSGKLAESVIPAIALVDTFVVASQAAMLALDVQRGDLAIRTDLNKSFVLQAEPASTLANWIELRTPTDAVLSVNGETGAVVITKGHVGLGNADDTPDSEKPISGPQAAAIATKVTKANDTGLGGFAVNGKPLGNLSGSLTPTHDGGNYQAGTITGALTINAPTEPGVYDLKIELLIGAGAGAVTLAGFSNTDFGEAFTTTEGDFFILQIEKGVTQTVATVRRPS